MHQYVAVMAKHTIMIACSIAAEQQISKLRSFIGALAKQQCQQNQQALLPVPAQQYMPQFVAVMARPTTMIACLPGAARLTSRLRLLTRAPARYQYQQSQ
jgi:hypothetical protein